MSAHSTPQGDSQSVLVGRLALVLPAYNEAEGIPGFLDELMQALHPLCADLSTVVVDDHSTDGTGKVLDAYAHEHPELRVVHAEENRGHGPTALAGYRTALALRPDLIVFVDGDGQFLGDDVARAVVLGIRSGADVVHGVRTGRTDPWYRKLLTGALGVALAVVAGGPIPDVNTPLRVYRPTALRALLSLVPTRALVPHVHFSLAESRMGMRRTQLRVRSIPRRGATTQGSMWGGTRVPRLPPARLRLFVARALGELWRVSLRPGAGSRARSLARGMAR
ncbi:MAG: glycosyltransferase family 2 protein [Microbacteriaceae bacterium]|nr:glycosyltransferase family 2 protein [Microbacteriaceae bacterium]MCI1207000.1 glycosyltransferase family 2 protein [Microbacteriaceae bacterium]